MHFGQKLYHLLIQVVCRCARAYSTKKIFFGDNRKLIKKNVQYAFNKCWMILYPKYLFYFIHNMGPSYDPLHKPKGKNHENEKISAVSIGTRVYFKREDQKFTFIALPYSKGLFTYYVIIFLKSQMEFCDRRSPQLVVAVGHNIFEVT